MGRAVLVVLLVLAALALVRALTRRAVPPRRPAAPGRAIPTVRCARCGVFVTPGQALTEAGRSYCSARCARAGQANGRDGG